VRDDLSVLSAFMAVAEERSFTRAARRLGVSPSALSHAVRGLEERLGVRLLARTTRSVAPTEAGAKFLAKLGPAMADVHGALHDVSGYRGRPAGRVRLAVSPFAGRMVLAPAIARFARAHPDVVLDVTVAGTGRLDLVGEGFDAGIHLGEFIQKDMIAVRVTRDQRAAIVGAPAYLKEHGKPASPRDLTEHRCLNFRQADGVYRWEFEKRGKALAVAVSGPLVVNDVEVLIRAAIDGAGLAFTVEDQVATHLAGGALVRVLEDWCPPFAGYFLYYPSRRQQPAALTALIEALRIT
jgi:DNA-binding transcriptional LysR family regulator